ncbi:hypothetical protein ACTUHY_06190 [Acidaminococcus sp. LBK-2]|uniref:hypothetical protein n=1 Tax=Acidaminococcus sp. LBK-2 TaxID=3456956 RepID=UPI003FA41B0A
MQKINSLLDICFYVFFTLTFGCAAFIVLGQAVAVMTMNAELAIWCKKLIVLNARLGAGVSVTTLVMGYLRGWMSGKKKEKR